MPPKERLGSDPFDFMNEENGGGSVKEPKEEKEPFQQRNEPASEQDRKDGSDEKNVNPGRKMNKNRESNKSKIKSTSGDWIESENLKVKVNEKDSVKQMILSGELTIYSVDFMKNIFIDTESDEAGFEIELSDIEKIDTAGFQLLFLIAKEAAGRGSELKLLNPSEEVRRIFALYGEEI